MSPSSWNAPELTVHEVCAEHPEQPAVSEDCFVEGDDRS
jgi:hypothetical protein